MRLLSGTSLESDRVEMLGVRYRREPRTGVFTWSSARSASLSRYASLCLTFFAARTVSAVYSFMGDLPLVGMELN